MKTALNVRIDAKVKKHAQEFSESVGLTLSGLINILLVQLIRNPKVDLHAKKKSAFATRIEKEILAAAQDGSDQITTSDSQATKKFLGDLMKKK